MYIESLLKLTLDIYFSFDLYICTVLVILKENLNYSINCIHVILDDMFNDDYLIESGMNEDKIDIQTIRYSII